MSLVGRAVLAGRALAARLPGAVVFVDTDDPLIADEGRRWGAAVPFLRDPALAGDAVPTSESILGALDRWAARGQSFMTVVLLQPTSPLRRGQDVTRCWDQFASGGRRPVVGIVPTPHPLEHAVRRGEDGTLTWAGPAPTSTRRQDLVPAWWISGAVYIIDADELRRGRTFVPAARAFGVELPPVCGLDVDVAADLELADRIATASPATPTELAGRVLGAGAPCFVIAEAGVNHNGDVELAHRLVDVAADAGADAVKFQTFDPDALAAPDAPKAAYQAARTGAAESQREMLRRLTLPLESYAALKAHAERRGLLFLSTAFDPRSADFLGRELGMPAFKVPSGELTNHPFLEHLARTGRPLLISTGMATIDEVGDALAVVEGAGGTVAALFHCVTSYPAAPEDCNLRAMATMRAAFGIPTGWSDHTVGLELSLAAVAAGAEILEKHFTLDRSLPGPDHAASLEPAELGALIAGVRRIETALGDGVKRPRPAEVPLAAVARRSLHAARALARGTRLTPGDLVALRPGTGFSPAKLPHLVGRTLARDVAPFALLSEADLG